MSTTPTLVVGLGWAGIGVLRALDEHGIETERTLAIDTNQQDLAKAPDGAEKLLLSLPESRFDADRRRYPYLRTDTELPHTGTARQRTLGRYAFDNAEPPTPEAVVGTLAETVETMITERSQDFEPAGGEVAVVWVHALGGGTGGGTFPLVAATLDSAAESAAARRGFDVKRFGLGIVPAPSADIHPDTVSSRAATHYANAYAGLRDLEHMLAADEESLEIPLYARASDGKSSIDALELDEPPVDTYFLAPVNEKQLVGDDAESYVRSVDRSVAEAVGAISNGNAADTVDAAERFEDAAPRLLETFASFAQEGVFDGGRESRAAMAYPEWYGRDVPAAFDIESER